MATILPPTTDNAPVPGPRPLVTARETFLAELEQLPGTVRALG